MVAFSYSGSLPQYKAPILSAQLRNRYNDIKDYLLAENALGLTFPTSVASAAQYDILLLNSGKTGFDFGKTIRSNVSLNHDAGNGSAGQLLRSDGDGTTSWVSVTVQNTPTVKTGDFSTAANDYFLVSTGVGTITLHSPAAVGEQFSIAPLLGTRSFITSPPTLAGAMQVAGAAIDPSFLNEDGKYTFISMDGTNWRVSAEPLA